MKFQHTIHHLHQQIIRVFARVDSWLDHLLDQPDESSILDILQHLFISNQSLLKHSGAEMFDQAMVTPADHENLRARLRDQLHVCLIMLDKAEGNLTENDEAGHHIVEQLYTLCYHIEHHLEALEREEFLV